jgi:hypothetical protein
MKLLVFYRPNSEDARPVESYVHDFQRQYHMDAKIEVMSLDTRDGAAMASLYDIMQYPALVSTRDDGSVQGVWQGHELPLMSEVAGSLR